MRKPVGRTRGVFANLRARVLQSIDITTAPVYIRICMCVYLCTEERSHLCIYGCICNGMRASIPGFRGSLFWEQCRGGRERQGERYVTRFSYAVESPSFGMLCTEERFPVMRLCVCGWEGRLIIGAACGFGGGWILMCVLQMSVFWPVMVGILSSFFSIACALSFSRYIKKYTMNGYLYIYLEEWNYSK